MCEYCGCQAVAAIDVLTREHDRAKEHAYAVRSAAGRRDLSAAGYACAALAAVLSPHSAVEEQALFPVMAREFGPQMAGLVDDHRLISAVLTEIVEADDVPEDWPSRLIEALNVRREHILKEQDGVFPSALATLTPSEWDALDVVRRTVGSPLAPVDRV